MDGPEEKIPMPDEDMGELTDEDGEQYGKRKIHN